MVRSGGYKIILVRSGGLVVSNPLAIYIWFSIYDYMYISNQETNDIVSYYSVQLMKDRPTFSLILSIVDS